MDEIRIGVAGLGGRGRSWMRLLQRIPGYRIVALCDPIVATHEPSLAVLKNSDGVATYTQYEDILADANVEAIALTVRSPRQGLLAAQALEAGKHVNQEVPAAHCIEDCWRIVVAAERSGKVYQLAEQTRYMGVMQAWHDMVAEGQLGRVTFVEGQYFHYYVSQFFWEKDTATFYGPLEVPAHPEAEPTWSALMPAIHYLPHELSPLLYVLDDRVVSVTGMSTQAPSYSHPVIPQPDMQVSLMKTEKDAILRLAASFAQPQPPRDYHWYQIMGTQGSVEWRRSNRDKPKMWLANGQMHDMAEVDWQFQRTDAPAEARGSGHGDADYYVHAAFRDAVKGTRPLEFDVYRAMDTAAPAILAAESIAQNSKLLEVPDFRPSADRPAGAMPADG